MRRFIFFILFQIIFCTAFSQNKYVSFRIDSAIRAAMAERQIPGMQVAVVKYGIVLKKGSYGMANLEDRVPVTDSTLFPIASMSKAFTCAAVLLLMEEGKLGIDDSVGKYFESLPQGWEAITIRKLMNHTSGLRDDWDENDIFFKTNTSDSAFFAALKAATLKFQPGQAWSYSCGPFVLGLIISKVSGESYADFMKHRIFDKLGMNNTRINDAEAVIPNRAAGYRLKDNIFYHGKEISAAAQARGDVGVLTTVTDMVKWYTALQNGSLLQKKSMELMFTPGLLLDSNKVSYGMGWFIGPYRDQTLISHNGGFRTGFSSVIDMYPEDHVGIIILSNRQNAGTPLIAKDIVGLFNPDYARASKMDSVSAPDSSRTAYLKNFYQSIGLNLDSARKIARELHLKYYPENESDLRLFQHVTDFTLVKSIQPSTPKTDIFGDQVQGIFIYRIKCQDQTTGYFTFLLDPSGRPVYMEKEE
jgi:D-alanyl-D-alanine carboxypeptidase